MEYKDRNNNKLSFSYNHEFSEMTFSVNDKFHSVWSCDDDYCAKETSNDIVRIWNAALDSVEGE